MKKTTYITALIAAGFAFTASAGEPTVVAPAVQPAPVPAVAEPVCACPISWEFAVSANLANGNIITEEGFNRVKLSTIGYDLTGVYSLNENNALTLRFGFASGKDKSTWSDNGGEDGYSWAAHEQQAYTEYSFYLMPGYRYTASLCDSVKGFFGVNVGIINHSLKFRLGVTDVYADGEGVDAYKFVSKAHGSAFGLAGSVEAGISYALSKSTSLFLAYQFSGSTAQPKLHDEEVAIAKARKQFFHSIRAGVGFAF